MKCWACESELMAGDDSPAGLCRQCVDYWYPPPPAKPAPAARDLARRGALTGYGLIVRGRHEPLPMLFHTYREADDRRRMDAERGADEFDVVHIATEWSAAVPQASPPPPPRMSVSEAARVLALSKRPKRAPRNRDLARRVTRLQCELKRLAADILARDIVEA